MASLSLVERWLIPGRDGVCCASLRPEAPLERVVHAGDWLQAEEFATKIVALEIYRTNPTNDLHVVLPADIYLFLYPGMEFEC